MAYSDVLTGSKRRNRRTVTDFGNMSDLNAAAGNAYNEEAGYGSDATQTYLDRAKNFNAADALNNYAQGAWGSVSEGLKKMLADQEGAAVGAGRFNTGYLDQDKGTVIRDVTRDFTNNIAQQSLNAAGLQERNDQGLGQFGQNAAQDANDMLTGQREFVYNQDVQADALKRKRRAGIGGLLGGALGAGVGFFAGGGPAGAAAGWKYGSQAGQAVGGY